MLLIHLVLFYDWRMADIIKTVDSILPEIVRLRHELHRIPEIAFKEFKTSAKIRDYLEGLGLTVEKPFLVTDVTAVLHGAKPGKTILLRADIDALPIEEDTDVSYRSEHFGFAHSCGHDGHIAILLGAAKILSQHLNQISGCVKFLFSPAEESDAGTKLLVEKGYLEQSPVPDEAYALHGWPGVKSGCVECCTGPIMASTSDFLITLSGAGGHGAMPESAVDLIGAAAGFILDLKKFASAIQSADEKSVVSVCSVNAGSTFNVFPHKLILKGTARFLKDSTGKIIEKRIKEFLDKNVLSVSAKYTIEHPKPDYTAVVNNPALFEKVKNSAFEYIGKDNWNSDGVCSMCGDDFGFITRFIPSVYFRLGVGERHVALHNPSYDFDDDALKNGILMMCALVLQSIY